MGASKLLDVDNLEDNLEQIFNKFKDSVDSAVAQTSQNVVAQQKQNFYRFALLKNATRQEHKNFRQSIQMLQQENPGWEVVQDWAQEGEEEAVVLKQKMKTSCVWEFNYHDESAPVVAKVAVRCSSSDCFLYLHSRTKYWKIGLSEGGASGSCSRAIDWGSFRTV
jgi:hypothetical protein